MPVPRGSNRRFYRPAYVGPAGWIDIRLDRDVGRSIVLDSYRNVGPKRLVALLVDEA